MTPAPGSTPGITPDITHMRRSGFTMAELIIVVSIMALLVTLLVPALRSSRRAVYINKCMTNLAAISMGFDNYLNDYRRVYPGGPAVGETNLFGDVGTTDATAAQSRLLNSYLNHDYSIAACPLDQGFGSSDEPAYKQFGMSYAYSPGNDSNPTTDRVTGGIWSLESRRETEITKKSFKAVMVDKIYTVAPPGTGAERWHSNGNPMLMSVLFADGSAEQRVTKPTENTAGTESALGTAAVATESFY